MPALSDIVQLSKGPTLLAVFLSVGAFSVVFHLLLHKQKIPSRLLQLFSAPKPEKSKNLSNADYVNVFPPPPAGFGNTVDLSKSPKASILKIDESYRDAKPSSHVFTGFRVSEIRDMCDFPDYAALSGVPLPSPLENFDIDKASARPYRPFRWSYHQTMSLTKMEPDFWIELESTYRERIAQRQELYKQHGKDLLQALPGSELACKELMEMVLQFLCARYPRQFEVKGNMFVNRILGIEQDLNKTHPLVVLLNHVPEDFGITLRDPETGRYCLRAGVICSSVGWNLGEKMGLGLPGIHKPVPDYKEKMQFSMDRYFTKMPTNSPIQRGSWGVEVGQPLYLQANTPEFNNREFQNPNLKPEHLYLRVDWQTLRRLPLSGGIVFSFKALFTPITEFRDEPYIPSIVLKIYCEGKENLMKYKSSWHTEHVVKPTMEAYEKEQIEKGLIEKDWKHHTLEDSPFFKDWKRKWRIN